MPRRHIYGLDHGLFRRSGPPVSSHLFKPLQTLPSDADFRTNFQDRE